MEGREETPDGLFLFWRNWQPAAPKAALLFVHGLAEHSGRYEGPARHFAARGYTGYALDCRGHGRSPGRRVHVSSFDEYVSDLRTVEALVRARHPDLSLFLVGHSLGGLIVLLHALRSPGGRPGIVVNSPFLGIHPDSKPPAILRLAARLLAAVVPRVLLPSGVDPRFVSRDPDVVAAYAADPLVSSWVSAGWAAALLAAFADAHRQAASLGVPALVMASGADRLVDTGATRRWVSQAPSALVELVVWDNLYHESFNEPEKQQVFAKMESWLEARRALPPSTPS